MNNYYWQMPDGQIWGFVESGWVGRDMAAGGILSLVDNLDELRQRIRLYHGDLGELATIEDLCPGDDYDLIGDQWVRRRFSKLAFFNLFTMNEKVAFKAAIAGGNLVAGVIHDSLTMADFIDVTDPATVEALHGLASETGGQVITAERAAEILAGVPHGEKAEN